MAKQDPKQWAKIESIIDQAYELAPDRRLEFINSQCDGDQQLLQTVVAMIEAMDAKEETFNF